MIEQTAVSRGMVKTPIQPATKETAAHAEYRHRPRTTQGPHPGDEAREKTQPQAQDAHSAARLRWLLANRDRPCPLLFAHHRLRGCMPVHRRGASSLLRPYQARAETVARREGRGAHRTFAGEGLSDLSWLAALTLELQAAL